MINLNFQFSLSDAAMGFYSGSTKQAFKDLGYSVDDLLQLSHSEGEALMGRAAQIDADRRTDTGPVTEKLATVTDINVKRADKLSQKLDRHIYDQALDAVSDAVVVLEALDKQDVDAVIETMHDVLDKFQVLFDLYDVIQGN